MIKPRHEDNTANVNEYHQMISSRSWLSRHTAGMISTKGVNTNVRTAQTKAITTVDRTSI